MATPPAKNMTCRGMIVLFSTLLGFLNTPAVQAKEAEPSVLSLDVRVCKSADVQVLFDLKTSSCTIYGLSNAESRLEVQICGGVSVGGSGKLGIVGAKAEAGGLICATLTFPLTQAPDRAAAMKLLNDKERG